MSDIKDQNDEDSDGSVDDGKANDAHIITVKMAWGSMFDIDTNCLTVTAFDDALRAAVKAAQWPGGAAVPAVELLDRYTVALSKDSKVLYSSQTARTPKLCNDMWSYDYAVLMPPGSTVAASVQATPSTPHVV